jgi:hypothetical protein
MRDGPLKRSVFECMIGHLHGQVPSAHGFRNSLRNRPTFEEGLDCRAPILLTSSDRIPYSPVRFLALVRTKRRSFSRPSHPIAETVQRGPLVAQARHSGSLLCRSSVVPLVSLVSLVSPPGR